MKKYQPLQLKRIAEVIVGDNTPNRLSGKDLVDFFNEFGFNDDYVYPNVGITTGDIGESLSRTDYTRKRLAKLNETNQIDAMLSVYIDSSADRQYAEDAIKKVLGVAPSIDTSTLSSSTSFMPRSQFDDIKPGVPTVFISYTWDDEEHKAWVLKLANDLRSKCNICSLIDRYNPAGTDIVEFMNKGIRLSDRVLIIGTPVYKEKTENGIGTGGKYEGTIITTEIYNNTDTCKFIPLLRRGDNFKSSFTTVLAARGGFDFRDDSKYAATLNTLADELYGRGLKAPSVNAASVVPNSVLSDPYKGEKWLKELMSHFSFYLMDSYFKEMPSCFNYDLSIIFDCWHDCLNSSAFQMRDKKLHSLILDFFNAWTEIVNIGLPYYCTVPNSNYVKFEPLKHDIITDPKAEEDFYLIAKKVQELAPKYKAMRDYLDHNYDIDFAEISEEFAKAQGTSNKN